MNSKCKTCVARTRYGINDFCGFLEVVLNENGAAPCEKPLLNNPKP